MSIYLRRCVPRELIALIKTVPTKGTIESISIAPVKPFITMFVFV